MRFDILTLFPNFFTENPYFQFSIVGEAFKKQTRSEAKGPKDFVDIGQKLNSAPMLKMANLKTHSTDAECEGVAQGPIIEWQVHNIRNYSKNKHKKVDDTPYGGGAGMVMTCQPLFDSIEDVKKIQKEALGKSGPVIFLTPDGKKWNQSKAERFSANYSGLILLCGRYEGIDQRVRDTLVDEEISIGDYVLTGGELGAMVLMDSITRLIPGVLGNLDSPEEDSFSKKFDRKKEYPHYTKPTVFRGLEVPEVLRSGNHKAIEEWRRKRLR